MSGVLSSPHAGLDFNRSFGGNRLKWQEHSAKRGGHSTGLNRTPSFRLSAFWSALIRSRATMHVIARVPKAAAPLKAPIGVCVLDDDLDAGARLEPGSDTPW